MSKGTGPTVCDVDQTGEIFMEYWCEGGCCIGGDPWDIAEVMGDFGAWMQDNYPDVILTPSSLVEWARIQIKHGT